MNWIIFCSFCLKMTFCRNIRICAWFMVMKGRMEDQVCLDMKMEVNNNGLWMGLTITWDLQYPAREFEISCQGKNESLQLLKPQHVLKNFIDHQARGTRSTWGKAMGSQNKCGYREGQRLQLNRMYWYNISNCSWNRWEALFGGFLNS